MTKENAIIFKDVRYCYGEVCAISNASFVIKQNALTALIGPNGGGKSTIIKLLTGLLKPEDGDIEIKDNENIGYVSQITQFDVSFPITVAQVVLSGTLKGKIKPFVRYSKAQKQKAEEAIARVGLIGKEGRGVNQLSGGQLERTMIARAIASDAKIIVLDEPDSSLDVDAVAELYAMLKDLKRDKTILVASHHLDSILKIADEALFIDKTVTHYKELNGLKKRFKAGLML